MSKKNVNNSGMEELIRKDFDKTDDERRKSSGFLCLYVIIGVIVAIAIITIIIIK